MPAALWYKKGAMEVECSKCHSKFVALKEGVTVCPDCLKNEFATSAPKLNEEERAALMAEYKASIKRQSARAENMGGMYATGNVFNVAGTLRLLLGLAIFGVCAFLFLISDKESGFTFLANEDIDSQRLFAMIFCVVSAGLVATASVYYKKTVYSLAFIILVMGWIMPNILQYALAQAAKEAAAIKAAEQKVAAEDGSGEASTAVMTDADLQVFTSLRSVSDRLVHYAVFIDNQDSRTRSLVRDAFTRLLQAEYTRAYTRANGALYVITNVPGGRKNISPILSRLGTVTHAAPLKGVYEVRFDVDKANLVSQYAPDVLSSPMNASYVTANLSELQCLDPMRVRMSARSLANSDVKVLRGEIRGTLLKVLEEPWTSEPDTYAALIDALVVYSNKEDADAARQCYRYFDARRSLKREVSPSVIRYLILQSPQQMVQPVVDMWCESPVAWGGMLNMLGYRVQPLLMNKLKTATDIRLIGTILKYLEQHGTKEAMPAVEPYLEHQDSIIRHSARVTQAALQNRN